MYRVEVDFAPAYELYISLMAFLDRSNHRSMDLGTSWAASVEKQLGPDSVAALADAVLSKGGLPLTLLGWRCPGPRDVDGFIRWLSTLSSGEIYDLVAPWNLEPLPRDLIACRDTTVEQLQRWNEGYFSHLDPAIIAGLAADAERKRALIGTMDPVGLVELATNGVWYTPSDSIDCVLLIPQYHHRPWNIYGNYHRMRVNHYPADAVESSADDPPSELMRLTRALADESRLRILKLVSGEQCTFTDLVALSGLAKSTVYHHLVALRSAGLVRVHDPGERVMSYSLRPGAEERLGAALRNYLIDR